MEKKNQVRRGAPEAKIDIKKVGELESGGMSRRDIAAYFDVHHETLARHLSRYRRVVSYIEF